MNLAFLFSLLLPPLSIYAQLGPGMDFWLNVAVFMLLGYVPCLLHGLYVQCREGAALLYAQAY